MSKKTVVLASLGTILEWAEYVFYGYMAVTLSSLFFPAGNEAINLIKTFGIFAAGYLMRPLGAILFGHIGDVHGRKHALMLSMLLMGLATLGIGLLPTYYQIGITAPILLLILRLIQGLAVSGEYNGAAIFVIEHSEKNKALRGSFIAMSASLGMVIGGLASYLVNLPNMPDWAYRVPFLLGGMGCFVALWIRNSLKESPDFVKSSSVPQINLMQLIIQFKRSFVRVGIIAAFIGIFVYIGNIYFVVYLNKSVGLSLAHATLTAVVGQTLLSGLIPVFGWISDKMNPRILFNLGVLAAIVGTPCFYAVSAFGTLGLVLSILLYATINGMMSGPLMKVLQDEFPVHVRYRGISLAWSLAVAVFGGTALMVAQMLNTTFDAPLAASYYVSMFGVITLLILLISNRKLI